MPILMPEKKQRGRISDFFTNFESAKGSIERARGVDAQSKEREHLAKQRAEDEDPGGPVMQHVRAQGQRLGIRIPENMPYRQFERTPYKTELEAKIKSEEDLRLAQAKGKAENQSAQRLPADKVLLVNEGQQIPRMLTDIQNTIEKNADAFGPVGGRLGSLNPYDTRSQTIDAQMRTSAQSFGRYMEGGVLRAEDERKYRAMFPALGDTPEVAANKLRLVDRMLKQKLASDVEALRSSGYDTRGLQVAQGEVPGLPQTLAGHGQQFQPKDTFASGPKVDAQDIEALSRAQARLQANPNDEKAKQVMEILRGKGVIK